MSTVVPTPSSVRRSGRDIQVERDSSEPRNTTVLATSSIDGGCGCSVPSALSCDSAIVPRKSFTVLPEGTFFSPSIALKTPWMRSLSIGPG